MVRNLKIMDTTRTFKYLVDWFRSLWCNYLLHAASQCIKAEPGLIAVENPRGFFKNSRGTRLLYNKVVHLLDPLTDRMWCGIWCAFSKVRGSSFRNHLPMPLHELFTPWPSYKINWQKWLEHWIKWIKVWMKWMKVWQIWIKVWTIWISIWTHKVVHCGGWGSDCHLSKRDPPKLSSSWHQSACIYVPTGSSSSGW